LHEKIEEYLKSDYGGLNYQLVLEEEPLGTGGAIQLAMQKTKEKDLMICNGDTMFEINVKLLSAFHMDKEAVCTLSLKPMVNFDRYGAVTIGKDCSVESFKEKQFYQSGLINGGVYALNRNHFLEEDLPKKFSFEKDYLEKKIREEIYSNPKIFGLIQDEYFIDIGIPEDYERAGKELIRKTR
jgi:D-glycero-alpha-D-manno-heptose 1-phosphate guanylyltransferase